MVWGVCSPSGTLDLDAPSRSSERSQVGWRSGVRKLVDACSGPHVLRDVNSDNRTCTMFVFQWETLVVLVPGVCPVDGPARYSQECPSPPRVHTLQPDQQKQPCWGGRALRVILVRVQNLCFAGWG